MHILEPLFVYVLSSTCRHLAFCVVHTLYPWQPSRASSVAHTKYQMA